MTYRIDPRIDGRWAVFLENHRDSGIFHTTAWLEALHRTYGYEPVVYTTTPPGRDLENGVPFCHVRSYLTGRRLVSLPFSDHCQPLANTEELHELLCGVKAGARIDKCEYVELKPLTPLSPDAVTASDLTASHEAVIHKLNLRRSVSEVVSGFHKNCVRRTIARSEREGLRYEEGRSEDLLQKFYRLLLMTRRRHGLPPQPLQWFRNLIACLGDHLKIRVASLKDGTPVASIVTLSYKEVVTYKYGCSDPRFNALGGTAMLLWRTIEEAMRDGAAELDLGRSDYDTPGLISFKDHWGADRYALTYYRNPATTNANRAHGFAATTARRLITSVPDSLFTTLGGFIYRHVA